MDTSEQLRRYQRELSEKLHPELNRMLTYRESLYEQVSHYLSLKNKIEMIQTQNLDQMDTLVNLGSDFYVQAKVY